MAAVNYQDSFPHRYHEGIFIRCLGLNVTLFVANMKIMVPILDKILCRGSPPILYSEELKGHEHSPADRDHQSATVPGALLPGKPVGFLLEWQKQWAYTQCVSGGCVCMGANVVNNNPGGKPEIHPPSPDNNY